MKITINQASIELTATQSSLVERFVLDLLKRDTPNQVQIYPKKHVRARRPITKDERIIINNLDVTQYANPHQMCSIIGKKLGRNPSVIWNNYLRSHPKVQSGTNGF